MHQLHLHNHYLMTLVICTTFNIVYNICFPSFIATQVIISHGTVTITDDDEDDIFEDDKRMRDTYLLGKLFVPNTEYLSKHPLLYLTFIFMFKCHFNRGIR